MRRPAGPADPRRTAATTAPSRSSNYWRSLRSYRRGHGWEKFFSMSVGDVDLEGEKPRTGIFRVRVAPGRAWMPVDHCSGVDEPSHPRGVAHAVAELIPGWVRQLGTAVWVSDPSGAMAYLNRRAEEMLGLEWEACAGRTCSAIVGGRLPTGELLCEQHCRVRRRAEAGREVEPLRLQIGDEDDPSWLHVMVIPVEAADGTWPWLVHCAIDIDRVQRLETYVQRVATRSEALRQQEPTSSSDTLTRREAEILDLLAQDEELGTIARNLHISHATVRNHTQRILAKLGAHSVQEAIAIHLLSRE